MKNKKIIGIVFTLVIISLIANIIFAQDWPAFNVCCEKTKGGAWCQNSIEDNCDTSIDPITKSKYRLTFTSCEASSFCKMGCCVDSEEGLCMENSPQKVCQISTGTWLEDPQCNVPQCSLGCCILGDQASFVTLTRCKRLSGLYGLITNFKKEVNNEPECIAMAYYQDKGACVFESDGQKTCKFSTRQECLNSNKKLDNSSTSEPEFFNGYLCSADELATNCGPTTDTICIPGKDEVYFKDSCGNPANIYDSSKIYSLDPSYWKKIVPKSETCGYSSKKGNINSKNCGNCNYLEGSICGKGKANYGENICKDLNCYKTQNGNNYKNGESWCVYQSETGDGKDSVGSRHFRHVCIQGEETIEPCADFRSEICIQDKISTSFGDFTEAACRINRWTDCIDQMEEEDCLNIDKRECYWSKGFHYDGGAKKKAADTPVAANDTSNPKAEDELEEGNKGILNGGGICLPDIPPGLKFWESGDAKPICSLGNSVQTIGYNTNIFGSKKCVKNCEPTTPAWANKMNNVCTSIGDCGAKENIAGKFTDDGVVWKNNGKRRLLDGVLSQVKESSESEEKEN